MLISQAAIALPLLCCRLCLSCPTVCYRMAVYESISAPSALPPQPDVKLSNKDNCCASQIISVHNRQAMCGDAGSVSLNASRHEPSSRGRRLQLSETLPSSIDHQQPSPNLLTCPQTLSHSLASPRCYSRHHVLLRSDRNLIKLSAKGPSWPNFQLCRHFETWASWSKSRKCHDQTNERPHDKELKLDFC